jgi:hypothetical protein
MSLSGTLPLERHHPIILGDGGVAIADVALRLQRGARQSLGPDVEPAHADVVAETFMVKTLSN